MTDFFDALTPSTTIGGPFFTVSRESIRQFCEASLDFNPLHLDDDYMQAISAARISAASSCMA